ncbi:MAG: DNA recombination protein RmuC [Candidatus Pacebacteria bacterium]|nr:DNA recombination protein RmuC [Candidatus Paceibacterota bacterium]
MTTILIVILVAIVAGFAGIFWYLKNQGEKKPKEDAMLSLQNFLQNQLNAINNTVNERLKENRESSERTGSDIHKQITAFAVGVTSMGESLKQVDSSLKDVSSFQQIFKTPKLRGNWGELALNHILSQYFPKEMFSTQYYFKSKEAVDAVLKLPDGKLLPIDSKFPKENYERMIGLENEGEREIAKKQFGLDVKREVDDIAQKYILPSEGTLDCAFMYIPAEAVFFEINNSFSDVVEYARSKKVILASPNTFYLMLQVVQRWARDLQISKQTQNYIKRMNRIVEDAKKLEDDFSKLGKHLSDARSSYDSSDKRLDMLKERTESLMELGEGENKLLE